jgi:hypothetical protein
MDLNTLTMTTVGKIMVVLPETVSLLNGMRAALSDKIFRTALVEFLKTLVA